MMCASKKSSNIQHAEAELNMLRCHWRLMFREGERLGRPRAF